MAELGSAPRHQKSRCDAVENWIIDSDDKMEKHAHNVEMNEREYNSCDK